MKVRFLIGFVFLALLACCSRVETRNFVSPQTGASPELSAIDSLMWLWPDSALMRLIPCFDTCCTDGASTISTPYNRHYAHLLLAELLYKNDYQQTNRLDLFRAVDYFDSLIMDAEGADTRGRDTSNVSAAQPTTPKNATPNDIFLAARAHYIKGVGYYENDSMVPACKEYLKALEIMEGHFGEKELVGKKAKFMAYIYNRLGDMFSEQFMMESAIKCYKDALFYCIIEPTSPIGVSNIYYRIGKQYDKMGEKQKANEYYTQAIERMPNTNNIVFRDIVSTKALNDYQLGFGIERSLNIIKQILLQSDNEGERLTRFLTISAMFFEEKKYDSALFYLESVFNYSENVSFRIEAAEYLRIIYDSLGNDRELDECIHFLALHKEAGPENKALVSKLEDMFQNYLNQKQKKQVETERERAVRNMLKKVAPLVMVVVLVILIITKLSGKKQLRHQQAEADKVLKETGMIHKAALAQQEQEARKALEEIEKQHEQELSRQRAEALKTEQKHRIQQSALSSRLKRSNKELRELKDQIKQQTISTNPKQEAQALSFNDEPICRLIMERVKEGQFLSQMDCTLYKDYALDKDQLSALRKAVDHHFNQFTMRISKAHAELTRIDIDYCCLYLLGLTDADIAALMQRAYNTVNERNSKLRRIFGSENAISITLQAIANEYVSN